VFVSADNDAHCWHAKATQLSEQSTIKQKSISATTTVWYSCRYSVFT